MVQNSYFKGFMMYIKVQNQVLIAIHVNGDSPRPKYDYSDINQGCPNDFKRFLSIRNELMLL